MIRLGQITLDRQGVTRRESLLRHDLACSTKGHADADRGSKPTPTHNKLLKRQCRTPRVMITDKFGSYGAAKKEIESGVVEFRKTCF